MILCPVLNLEFAADQPDEIVDQVADRCYRPLVEILEGAPESRVTLAIDGPLLDRLESCGAGDVVEAIAKLTFRGQVELTGSANGNSMLRGMERGAIDRHIDEHAADLLRHFGDLFRPSGFFPPELAWEGELGEALAARGTRWVLVDEVAAGKGELASLQQGHHSVAGQGDLQVFFRHRGVSTGMIYRGFETAADLLEALGVTPDAPGYVVTANAAEIFGYHHAGYESLLASLLAGGSLQTETLSGVLESQDLPQRPIDLRVSTWGTWETLQY